MAGCGRRRCFRRCSGSARRSVLDDGLHVRGAGGTRARRSSCSSGGCSSAARLGSSASARIVVMVAGGLRDLPRRSSFCVERDDGRQCCPSSRSRLLCLGLVAWAAISHRLPGALRFPALVAALVLACRCDDARAHRRHQQRGLGTSLAMDASPPRIDCSREATTIRSRLPPLRTCRSAPNAPACCRRRPSQSPATPRRHGSG